jgi:hypothetical protein
MNLLVWVCVIGAVAHHSETVTEMITAFPPLAVFINEYSLITAMLSIFMIPFGVIGYFIIIDQAIELIELRKIIKSNKYK